MERFTKKDFYYDLDPVFIAQGPIPHRSESKLLVMDRKTGSCTEKIFSDILDYLSPGDALVLNNSKVLPARLMGKLETGGKMEILLLEERAKNIWEVLVNPGKKASLGKKIVCAQGEYQLIGEVVDVLESGNRLLKFSHEGDFYELLQILGEMPLPPYIHQKLDAPERYQTVFAKPPGSAAAPTAGLHFTQALLEAIEDKGVHITYITLHVGLGTFRPIKDSIETHKMHEEWYEISRETADILNETKKNRKKIIAVGTTSCRTLETVVDTHGVFKAQSGKTGIFIQPGYEFKAIDGLITNFHLPESTLLMLIAAFSKRSYILEAYEWAKKREFRFFSFGDAMFLGDI